MSVRNDVFLNETTLTVTLYSALNLLQIQTSHFDFLDHNKYFEFGLKGYAKNTRTTYDCVRYPVSVSKVNK